MAFPPRHGGGRPPGGRHGRRRFGGGDTRPPRGEGRFRRDSGGGRSGPDRKFRDGRFRPDKDRGDRAPGSPRRDFGDRGTRPPREFGERGPGAGRKFGHGGPGPARKFGDRGPRSPREFGESRPGARSNFRDRDRHRQGNRAAGGRPERSDRPDDRSGRGDRFKRATPSGRGDRFERGGRFDRGERHPGPRFERGGRGDKSSGDRGPVSSGRDFKDRNRGDSGRRGAGERFDRGAGPDRDRGFERGGRGPGGDKRGGGGPPRWVEGRAGRQRFERKFGKLPRAGSGPGRAAEPPRFQPGRRPDPAQRPEQSEPRFERGTRVEIARSPGHALPAQLLVATEEGEIYDHPVLEVLPARPGDAPPAGSGEDGLFRPLPWGSRVVMLPGRRPVGWDPRQRRRVEIDTLEIHGEQRRVFAAAAVLAPAWLRLRCPVFARTAEAPQLPQWAYADAGWRGEGVVAATIRIDPHTHWDPRAYNTPDLKGRVERRLAAAPANRVLRQLARCALEYSCTTAQNIFYQRHEGALPVSAACNAECLGCLSYRPPGEAPSSHERVPSTARVEDLVEVALEHLRAVPDAIVSFGQGCEGEPLLAGERIERAIIAIRSRTRGGTLHLNSNASLPAAVGKLFTAGLDSIRVSLNSAVGEHYARYYKPSGYSFEDVRAALGVARGKGGFVSLNVLVHPGFSDRPSEIDALTRLVNEFRVDLVQLRNLAIDPDDYLGLYPEPEEPLGMGELLGRLRTGCPTARIGNFNLPKEEWGREVAEVMRGGGER